jgi:carbon-monoxide dehydrogenase iron sulfur subunit
MVPSSAASVPVMMSSDGGSMDTLNIDAEKCTACMACELACSFAHEGVFVPTLSRIRVVRFMGEGHNVPVVCVNCARPACVEVCPTGAAYVDRSVPVVRSNEEDCIGCGECVKACPFGAADFNDEKEVAIICDLCDGDPACVKHCIYGALTFEPVRSVAQRKRRATAEAYAHRDHIA